METQAYFTGIREQIIGQLNSAKSHVVVAVAWMTDRDLFDSLVACQRRGVQVSVAVLDDRINRKSTLAWERLTALGGHHYWIPEGTNRAGSLHHKFCLIDGDTVINGSFNWTQRASSADENIVVIHGDTGFANQFQLAFERLLDKHGHEPEPGEIDRTKLLSRLTLICKLIELEEYDDIASQAEKIAHAWLLPEIAELIDLLDQEDWQQAHAKVVALLARGLSVTVYQDPRIPEWRWQVRMLETQVLALEAELADMGRQIHLFDSQQEEAIGDLIREYLDVKRQVLHARYKLSGGNATRKEAEAADSAYYEYEHARAEQAKEPKPQQLDAQQQGDLKTLFRKLAKRCHPDHMNEKDKEWATEMFKLLNAANRNSDLEAMQKLGDQIERGPRTTQELETPEHFDDLQFLITSLQQAVARLGLDIAVVARSATWQTIATISDWNEWFLQKAKHLRDEIAHYKAELNRLEMTCNE
jgi:hypothetical protein